MITYDQVQAFDRDGFVQVPLFSAREAGILSAHAHDGGGRTRDHLRDMPDAAGRSSKLALWTDLGEDVFGAVSASRRIVDSARALLREDVYHWHSKVMLKEPGQGGAWEWHQDYGYWYHDACAYPRLVSCLIALDRADRGNGCLKVLVGSHHLGRLDHGTLGSQAGADPGRIAEIERRLEVRYIEVEPGTALFFHCNLLHSSEQNRSDRWRTSYICCYNGMSNAPILTGRGHGRPEPIALAPDDAIERIGLPVGATT
ncbi:MAG: phytanoyl-CoA dioxygenase family protein [Planctomycetes bacterium]|nr:phytanoyl-CoA dioxygenase family protein [Planctomycetota bacterium]